MTYQVPYSSSPPSTPDRRSSNGRNIFGLSNPSTTPAGPPPSSAGSFTPAGPPPSSILGSSMLGANSPLKPLSFSQQSTFSPSQSKLDAFNSSNFSNSASSSATPKYSVFQPPKQRGFHAPHDSEEEEYEEGDDTGEYMDEDDDLRQSLKEDYTQDTNAMMDDDASYEEDEDMNDDQSGARSNGYAQRSSSDLLLGTPGALVKTQEEDMRSLKDSFSAATKPSIFGKIAKDMYTRIGVPNVEESDDLVLDTEAIITNLYEEGIQTEGDDSLQHTLGKISGELTNLWTDYQSRTATYSSEEYTATIGPGPRASNFAKANFLAGLALNIHHSLDTLASNTAKTFHPSAIPSPRSKAIPGVLVEWLGAYHDPYTSQFDEIQVHRPSPANHQLFWGAIFNGILRGKMVSVINTLKDAGWRHARGGMDDMRNLSGQVGFTGQSLINIEKVASAAVVALSTCPGIDGDWNTRGSDWTLFRLRVSQSLEDLKNFAEGKDRGHNASTVSDRFGKSSMGTYSTIARKAESQVPWSIYQNFLTLYSLVLGDSAAVISNAQDWCEATVGLVLWWDGGKNNRRSYLGQSRDNGVYLRRLREALALVTGDTTDFQVNTLNPVEVGLASLIDGDNEAVVGFLRAWSGPVSSAVAEVASIGGWLPPAEPQSLINMGSLDQDDMDLLGINSSPSKTDGIKDQTLIIYARSLTNRGELQSTAASQTRQQSREGWELAIAVLGRLDSVARSEEMVGNFLSDFHLDSAGTVDKLWVLLIDIGMTRHAEASAESYADILAEDSHNYGEALWYYALAHKETKVKDVLDLLISLSLVQSMAFPPDAEMDNYLRSLVSSPKTTLTDLSKMDVPAAELLHKLLSGYATLRKFYDLRDEEVLLPKGLKPQKGAVTRKSEAAAALLAVITSSDDNIRGGLYDEERGAVVSVDFLLALLGEAMVFVNQPNLTISTSQIDILLKAIEDIQTVGPRVYSACMEFLQTVIASATGLKGSSPTDMLRKSTSNTSGTSSFSMVGSSMLASQLKQSMGGSGVLVKGNIKRGWDWRRGVSAGTTGDDVLRILRLGLAKDLAKAWLLEADGTM
ncbi:Nucleoporin [Lachnellula hyalina]|uniref:Nucleoporin n=1 Tax=Lachnellula hyalina TaxID=1316788 RepID=A0A8H8RBB7_9HELO|nr:Nucleoporin [Lachnellula hyalina]TVY31118.1 Nucleoporin [Lachnellula hyalina]